MSNANVLTWDNMEEVIGSLPKDDNGRFLPNPNQFKKSELTLSTEGDSWVDPSSVLTMETDGIVDLPAVWTKEAFDLAEPIIKNTLAPQHLFLKPEVVETIVDVLIDDGFINKENRDLWLKTEGSSGDDRFVIIRTEGGVIEIRNQATSAPNESVVKIGTSGKLFVIAAPEPMAVKQTVDVGKDYNEDLSAKTTGTKAFNEGMRLLTKLDEQKALYPSLGDGLVRKQTIANFIISNVSKATHENCKCDDILSLDNEDFFTTVHLDPSNYLEISISYPPSLENIHVTEHRAINNMKIDLDQSELDNDPLLRAQRSLANLDTTEAEAELAQQAEAMERAKQLKESGLLEIANSPLTNPNMTPAELRAWSEANVAKAKASIIGVDKLITYAGRLNVKDKFLMNCPADLNQLIPFKYNWAWSFYLTSSSNHWMPGELSLYRIVEEFKTASTCIKKLVARAWFTHNAKFGLFGEGVLVNLYRQITNPESRQYLLRQGQEFIVVRHAWVEINDCLNIKDTLINGLTPVASLKADNDIFNKRTLLTRKYIQHLRDLTSTTETKEKLTEFLKAFIVGYTCTNWITPLVSYYQVITALEFNETCQPLAHMFMNLIRDNISQFEFAKLFIAGVMEENPQIYSDKWRDEVLEAMNNLIDHELALTVTLSAGENDTDDIKYICNHYRDEMMSIIDSSYQKVVPVGDHTRGQEFIHVVATLTPAVDHNAGLGAVQW